MKKSLFFLQALIFFVVLLSILQVVVSNSLSTTGVTLGKLEDEINIYKRENQLLKEKLLSTSSLFYIASEAATLGFVEGKSQVFLSSPLPLAVKP